MKTDPTEQQLTDQELNQRKEEMKQYFEDAIPFLEIQCKYEKLISEISEFKFKRFHYDSQLVTLMNQLNPSQTENPEVE